MTGAFSTLGSIGYPQTGWGTMPYGALSFGASPWQQQIPQQLFQLVPQQLHQLHYLQQQQLQVLQQLQQVLQIVPQQLHQLQHILQFVPQQIQQPFGQGASGIGGGFGTPFLSTPLFGPQSFPSHVM